MKGGQILSDGAFDCHSRFAGMYRLNHPACSRQVDSGLRRNDEGGCGQAFVRHGKGAVGMATRLFSLRRHSSESSPTSMQACP